MDAGVLHEKDDSCSWMSQLFEQLDLEVDEEDIFSTEKMTKNDAHSLKDKREESMSDRDNYLSCHTHNTTGTSLESSTCPRPSRTLADPCSSTLFHPSIGARYRASDEEAEEYYNTKRRLTYGGRPRNERERMSDECLLAFKNYVQDINLEDTEYKFGELRYRCYEVQDHGKIYQHFNFTMRTKLYFAEVKQLSGVKYYFCCPLERTDNGDCYECESQQIGDLKHPRRGGYEEGYILINLTFIWLTIHQTRIRTRVAYFDKKEGRCSYIEST